MTFVLPVFSARAEQDVVDADEVHVSKLATIFWGIVGYTHWPNGEESLRVCLSGDDQHLTTIRQSAIELGHKTTTLFAPENAANACDVVYVSGTGMSEVDRLSRSADGAPVLTIGDGERFCSMGGMFCLLSSEEGSGEATIDRFAINEDVVSRSALRINPQVLRLSKRNREH
ncbi:MAG: YfiR family protein [Betaproteobacteria bacterium]|nr:YfiR family protein [Betaproteobacteria bacterium]